MMKFSFLFLITTLILVSCAKRINPVEGYAQLKKRDYMLIDKIEYVSNTKMSYNEYYESSLSLKDSVLVYDDTIYSNYKAFSFKIQPQKTYTLKVSSISGMSFSKDFMFNPEMFVINNKDRKIEVKYDSTYFDSNYFDNAYLKQIGDPMFALNKVWTIRSGEEIKCTFLVFSNNQNLSKLIFEHKSPKFNVLDFLFSNEDNIYIPDKVEETMVGKFFVRVDQSD